MLFRNLKALPNTRKPDVILFPKLSDTLKYGLDMGWREDVVANRSGIYVFYLQDPRSGKVFMYGKVGFVIGLIIGAIIF